MLTDEQKKKRKKGLGGSDSPIVMGYSSFMTPYELYLEKKGMLDRPDEETDLQAWGHRIEPLILRHFAERHDCDVVTPETIYHSDYDFIFANLDGYSKKMNAVIEAKTLNAFMKYKLDTEIEDGMPYEYLIQVAKQVGLANADVGFCAVLVGGNEYIEFLYHRNKQFENYIFDADQKFWHMVQNNIEPELKTIDDCKKKYKDSLKDKSVMANFQIGEKVASIQNCKNNIKQIEQMIDGYKMDVMQFMKDKEILIDMHDKAIITWKKNKKGSRVFNIKG